MLCYVISYKFILRARSCGRSALRGNARRRCTITQQINNDNNNNTNNSNTNNQ